MRFHFVCFAVFFLLIRFTAFSQCDFFPADCPDQADIDAAEDSSVSIANKVTPAEIIMENMVRKKLDTEFDALAKKNGWRIAILNEITGHAYHDEFGHWYTQDMKPPHDYVIVYECVVNGDSLNTWKNWKLNKANADVQQLQTNQNAISSQKDLLQQYQDSITHYSTLAGQDASNQAKMMDDINKANAFGNKINDITNSKQAQQDQSNEDSEKVEAQERFHDACLLQVTVACNSGTAETAGSQVAALDVPGSVFAAEYVNPKPDMMDALNYFTHSKNLALILLGSWNTQPDGYGNYHGNYIPSDKDPSVKSNQVQGIDIHLSGNKKAILTFLSEINMNDLNHLLSGHK